MLGVSDGRTKWLILPPPQDKILCSPLLCMCIYKHVNHAIIDLAAVTFQLNFLHDKLLNEKNLYDFYF